MKIANLHDDIGTDLYQYKDTQPNRLDAYHYPKLKQGGITFSAIVCFFDGKQSWQDMQSVILYCEQQICNSAHFSFQQDKDIQVFMAVEGMCGIKNNVEAKIDWLYEHHIRVASLVWNEDNALACGAKSGDKPLTPLGIQCIQQMNKKKMLIDVSHLCIKGFNDILQISTQPIIATHSNATALCHHVRNLNDEQLQAIKKTHSMIGCVPIRYFTNDDTKHQNMASFIEMILYIMESVGETQVGFGFDFMDYATPEDAPSEMIDELENITCLPKLVNALTATTLTSLQITHILYTNVYRFLIPFLQY